MEIFWADKNGKLTQQYICMVASSWCKLSENMWEDQMTQIEGSQDDQLNFNQLVSLQLIYF